LLDDYQVVYAPSATVLLKFCQQKRVRAPHSLLAVGYNGANLRHTEAEAQAIADLATGGVALLKDAATNQALFAQAEQFRWIHLACHGRFNPQAPLMSYLRLAEAPLYAADVLQHLRLQAELVTLGACETGRNQVLKGDELLGLVRAFLYAGTPSVLVSLWPVDELSTRILMEHFYGELLAGQPTAEALRIAQQHLRSLTAQQVEALLAGYGEQDPQAQVRWLAGLAHADQAESRTLADTKLFAHPYFWASFVLVGDQL
jgi:CHAT domain-containing protein